MVDSEYHTYLTDNFIVTHNTYVTANLLTDAIDKGAKRILVAVPANLKEQSAEDGYKKFCPDDVAAKVKWASEKMSPEARRAMYAEEGIHVVSHNALQNDAKWLQEQGWDMVVTDEVHQLVNSKESQKGVGMGVQGSASYRSLEKIAAKAERHVAMTGTPIKTDKSEVYKIGKLLGAEQELGTIQEFTKRYKDVNQSTNAFGAAEVDAMRRSLASFSYSQSYELDVKKQSNRISVTSSSEQRREYRRIMDEYRRATEAGEVGASGTRDANLWRAAHLTGGRENSKFRSMVEHIKGLPEGDKALAFFSQGPAREGAETYAKQLNEEFGDGFAVHVTSSVSRKKISEYKRAIQGDPAMVKKYPNLRMIVATDTLATGHNLQGAHTVYKIDTPQSRAQDDQQSARSYRNGQTKDVNIVYFEGDDPNDINKRYNFRKKSREAELMGNPESVATKDDSGFGTHLLRAQDESNGEKHELRQTAA
jgi:superfamily II DNA or RNA helicase